MELLSKIPRVEDYLLEEEQTLTGNIEEKGFGDWFCVEDDLEKREGDDKINGVTTITTENECREGVVETKSVALRPSHEVRSVLKELFSASVDKIPEIGSFLVRDGVFKDVIEQGVSFTSIVCGRQSFAQITFTERFYPQP